MDSLLDALTNVVGILLLVLILTSISMSDVVDRIVSELKPVSPEELQANILTRDKRLEDKANLKSALEQNRSLEEIEKQKRELDLQLEALKSDESVDDLQNKIKAIELAIKTEKEKKDTQTTENQIKVDELTELRKKLEVAMSEEGPPPTVVMLPNPRSAPEAAEPRYVLCVFGKLYYVGDIYQHAFKVRDQVDSQFDDLLYTGQDAGYYTYSFKGDKERRDGRGYESVVNRDGKGLKKFRYDSKKVASYFKANDGKFGTKDVAYKVTVDRDKLKLAFVPRPEGGMTISQFRAANSPLVNAFKSISNNRNYLYFHVAPDSFDVYIAARDLANSLGGGTGVPNGWAPWSPDPKGTFVPSVPEAVKIKRQFEDYDFASGKFIPFAKTKARASAIEARLDSLATAAEAEVPKTKDPKVVPAVERWARMHRGQYHEVAHHLNHVDPRNIGRESILVEPQVPHIPHIYLFSKFSGVPTEPLPERKPAAPKTEKPEAGRDVLD